ncbi:MAG TPA: peptide deformylase [Deltaproteobacteria bacterium]|nr:peptide deformylase [Deltaproteobacteria bacterium]
MLLDIVKYPDKRLREKSTPLGLEEIAAPEFQALLDNMFETMYAAPGVGLAAVQIGVMKRVMVLDVGIPEGQLIKRDPRVLINPEFISQEGEVVWEEGCLSCPDLAVPVQRAQRVVVRSLDRHGKPQESAGENLLAVALQHEVDHMDGILILDKLSRLKQELYRDKLKKGAVVR